MTPKKPDNGPRPNRIRFIMLDADISDGNLSQLTEAITSALKPGSVSIRQLPARTAVPPIVPTESPAPEEEHDEASGAAAEAPADDIAKAAKANYKPPLPTYLHDLDLKGTKKAFKEFAEKKGPSSHAKRCLVAALWLKEYGNSSTITVDQLFTCYKTAGWPLNISDWDVQFRNQVKRDRFRRVSSKEYAITPLGESDLQGS